MGLFAGCLDGALALRRLAPAHSFSAWHVLGGISLAVVMHAAAALGLLFFAFPFTQPALRGQGFLQRVQAQLALCMGLGAGAWLYWFSRPFLFSGLSALSPQRLSVAAVCVLTGVALLFPIRWVLVRLGRRLLAPLAAAAALLSAVGLIYWISAAGRPDRRGSWNERNRDCPNVLLFVVDALRADYLGCYGDERTKTPVIDALAERGVLFENAFVQAPYTWTSFGSILTGKYPRRHGLVKMQAGVRMSPNVTLPVHLKSARRRDGQTLRPEDFLSATFMTGTLSHGTGLMQGFDVYFEAMAGHELVDLSRPWSVFRSELLLFKFKNKLAQRLDRELVASEASRWLRGREQRRFMAMVHYFSTHTPYDPPARYRDMYVQPDYEGPIHAFYASSRQAIERGEYTPTEADREQIANLYRAGVTQADAMIGRVLEELERSGELEETLVIVTSDHGEELGDHGLWEHNFMYQTNLRVPLVLTLPRALPQGLRIDALVESIDILPSVCSLLGLELPQDEGAAERGFVDGHDLLPLIRGELEALREYSFSENGRYLSVQDRNHKLVVEAKDLGAESWSELLEKATSTPELYHLAADPLELDNAALRDPEAAQRLYLALKEWDERMPIPRHEVVPSHRDHEADLLRELGYADGIGRGTNQDP
jgi:arylsulfatase A-like enzyme